MLKPLHGDDHPHAPSLDADRNVKIERLLLAGLDHYFTGRYERAIDIWTRVLFLDRAHARARAYIERARAALSEQLRESEELVHTGVEAFERGDVTEARSLLTSAVEQGGGRDEALTILERLNRLEAAAGGGRVPRRGEAATPTDPRELDAVSAPETHRVRVVPLVVFVGLLLVAGYLAPSWGEWEALLDGRPGASALAPVRTPVEPLPLPSGDSVRISHARRLAADGRLHQALSLLDAVAAAGPLSREADVLRASIQRELLAVPSPPISGSGTEEAGP